MISFETQAHTVFLHLHLPFLAERRARMCSPLLTSFTCATCGRMNRTVPPCCCHRSNLHRCLASLLLRLKCLTIPRHDILSALN
jgi:hypothetical protein